MQQSRQYDKLSTSASFALGNRLGIVKSILQTYVQVIYKQEEPIPKTVEEVVICEEQKVRDQAGCIIDKYQALLRRYAGALLTFKAVLDAPSSKEVQPQVGKVLLDYVTEKIIGKVAENIRNASYVYEIYNKIQNTNKEVEKANIMK